MSNYQDKNNNLIVLNGLAGINGIKPFFGGLKSKYGVVHFIFNPFA